MTQFELIKQLEYLVAFQTNCLSEGKWETFDRTENTIRDLEEKIMIQGGSINDIDSN